MATTSAHTPQWKYDVFLSFRGEDTRKNFVDHLYHSLYQSGIHTFKDDEELRRGEEISPALLTAIEQSRIGLVVFSKNYASSKWCLDELAKMVEWSETMGQIMIPVFYYVNPSEVRKQTGRYGSEFEIHEKSLCVERVERWKEALMKAANRSGYTVSDVANGHESKCIQLIIEEILSKLNHSTPISANDLVGIEPRVEEVKSLLQMESTDVLFLGLWGMGGIGKTTVAEAVYDRISQQFEGSCFLKNVRELSKSKGLEALQEKLLSEVLVGSKINITSIGRGANMIKARLCGRRVLVVFDDVDQLEQLKALGAKHDWFGSGSRIIITTRDQHLLTTYEVTKIYEVKALEYDAAIQLFSSRAFKKISPHENYMELSEQIVHYTAGLPLALETLGSSLCGRTMDQWEDTLSKLRKNPDRKILQVLEISYQGLDEMEKKIFLDISCFFKGQKKDFVTRILKSCDFHSDIGLSILVERSLITISEDHIWMHDLVQEMAWDIVRQESEEPGKRSRLWLREDVRYVLAENTGTEKVEGISLKLNKPEVVNLNPEAFREMKKLRLLKVHKVLFSKGPSHLPNELRLLDWHAYPSACLPLSFEAENLVELRMCYSSLNQLWKKIKPLPKLKVIDLSHSHRLSRTPDFTAIPNLETLILEKCTSLVEVHSSLGGLKRLVFLNLKGCTNLKRLPCSIHLVSLETLILSGCSKLEKFPEILVNIERLSELHLDGSAIKELPSSISLLTSLTLMDLGGCKNLKSLPRTICRLRRLKTLILSGCSKLEKFPEILVNMECLSDLHLDGTAVNELPSSISLLTSLKLLDLGGCKNLTNLPRTICRLSYLKTLKLSGCSKLEELPEDLGNLKCLEELHAGETAIKRLPASINHLEDLKVLSLGKGTISQSGFSSWFLPRKSEDSLGFVLPSLTGLYSLTELDLNDCNLNEGGIPSNFGSSLSSLKYLYLKRNDFVTLPTSISQLSQLEVLDVGGCKRLEALPELPFSIDWLWAEDCQSLISIENLSAKSYRSLDRACFTNCFKLLENKWSTEYLVDMFLKLVVQRELLVTCCFHMVLPGREIPEWFSHQYLGSRASLQLPTDWYNERLLGIVTCASLCTRPTETNSTVIVVNEWDYLIQNKYIKSGHIFLGYLPSCRFRFPTDCCLFEAYGEQVTKWGMRLVYREDVQCFEGGDGGEGSDVAAVEVEDKVTPLKRKRDDCDRDEAQGSGSAYSHLVDEN